MSLASRSHRGRDRRVTVGSIRKKIALFHETNPITPHVLMYYPIDSCPHTEYFVHVLSLHKNKTFLLYFLRHFATLFVYHIRAYKYV